MSVSSSPDIRWQAVRTRDARADGDFFYGVRTTGIYCRPSCPARRPSRENVTFHASAAAAEAAGYRACRRCRPRDASGQSADVRRIAKACRLIERAATPPSLAALAGAVHLSAFHFHRLFKHVTGLTPRAYAAAHRHRTVREELQQRTSITAAIAASGYGSSSRFYEQAVRLLGMTAGTYRDGGRDARIRFAVRGTSLGPLLVAATARGVCAIEFGRDERALRKSLQARFPQADLLGGDRDFETLVERVLAQVERPQPHFELPLDVRGTAFQHRVWQALSRIPAGATTTYTDIAHAIGRPTAVRAVAQACAANQAALAIPCHRVIRADAGLGGYRWGVARKRALLKRERELPLERSEPARKK